MNNKDPYNIRVVNLSVNTTVANPITTVHWMQRPKSCGSTVLWSSLRPAIMVGEAGLQPYAAAPPTIPS